MRALETLTLFSILLLAGCASLKYGKQPYAELNARAATRTATVVLTDGTTFPANAVRVTPDSTYWLDTTSAVPMSAPTARIGWVSFKSPATGIKNGIKYGALAGTVIGAVLGFLSVGECEIPAVPNQPTTENGCLSDLRNKKGSQVASALYGGYVGVWYGLGSGLIGGAVLGGKKKYPITHRN